MLERATGVARWKDTQWKIPRRVFTLIAIMVSWAIFRAPNAPVCWEFLKSLAGIRTKRPFPFEMTSLLDAQTILVILIGMLSFVAPRSTTMGTHLSASGAVAERWRAAVILILLPVVILQVLASDYSPFLYFQF